MRPQAHVYYRRKDGNFVIHYSDRAHKWLLIAVDAGPVIDEIDGSIAGANALDDDFFPPNESMGACESPLRQELHDPESA